jgi:hypothetical protein
MSNHRTRVAILSALLIMSAVLSVARAAEHSVRAVAPWEGRMRIYVMGEQQALALGVFTGRLKAEPETSPLHGAELLCPGSVDLDYAANTVRGNGHCAITTASQERLFARWMCTGVPERNCAGRFVLTGGTGAYQGVTGSGDLSLQLTLADLTRLNRLESEYDVKGLATWTTLQYRTP